MLWTTAFMIDWINRMAKKHGGIVANREGGLNMDWGQAICYGRYGPNWSEIMNKDQIVDPDSEAVELAKQWEDGELPEWMYFPAQQEAT